MTVFTEPRWAGEFILSEENDGAGSRETITVVAGAGVIAPGSVLGKITASGKYQLSPDTGADGSQVASVIAINGCDATTADKQIVALVRFAQVNGNGLTYHSTVSDDTKKTAKQTQLAASPNFIITR